jgi:hypothetical protein
VDEIDVLVVEVTLQNLVCSSTIAMVSLVVSTGRGLSSGVARSAFLGGRVMGLIVLFVVLVLLFGGGGFYFGPPYHYYGGGLGLLLLIVVLVLLFRGRA